MNNYLQRIAFQSIENLMDEFIYLFTKIFSYFVFIESRKVNQQ